jgi:hypothetical protein
MIMNLRSSDGTYPEFSAIAKELTTLQERLRKTHSKAENSIDRNAAMKEVAIDLHQHIDSAIKPISKRLWLTSVYRYPQLKFWRLLVDATAQLKYPTYLVALTLALSGLFLLAPDLGWSSSLVSNISFLTSFLLLDFSRKKLNARFSHLSRYVNIFFILSIGMWTSAVSTFVLNVYNGSGSFLLGVIVSPYASVLIVGVSAISLALSDRRLILQNLKREVQELSQESLLPFQSSHAASYIHNSLQSELTALALEFESESVKPEVGRSKALMEKLDALIRRSFGEDFANFIESPELRLARILDSWSQIIELKSTIDPLLFQDAGRGNLFVQLVEESLANAVRKGGATRVFISATLIENQLQVEITDNGTFDQRSTPGMGTDWIERHSDGDWSFEITTSGTVLRVQL